LKLGPGKIAFRALDQSFTEQGALAESVPHDFAGVFLGRHLVLDSPGLYGRQVLKRIAVPSDVDDDVEGGSSPMPIRRCR
jgi:hypothetical protein